MCCLLAKRTVPPVPESNQDSFPALEVAGGCFSARRLVSPRFSAQKALHHLWQMQLLQAPRTSSMHSTDTGEQGKGGLQPARSINEHNE